MAEENITTPVKTEAEIIFLFSKALRPMMFSSKLYCLSLSHG